MPRSIVYANVRCLWSKIALLICLSMMICLTAAQSVEASDVKVVYVELVEPGTSGTFDTFTDRYGNKHQIVETIILDPQNNINEDFPTDLDGNSQPLGMTDADKKLKETYDLIREGPLSSKLKSRMQHADNDLTVYLVDDQSLQNHLPFWPCSRGDTIIIGANAINSGRTPPGAELMAHEVTHHIDNTNQSGWEYGLPEEVIHDGTDIYESEYPAFVEGIAIYYEFLESPAWKIGEPPTYRKVEEVEWDPVDERAKYPTYRKEDLQPEELWRNETLTALILFELSQKGQDGQAGIDTIFYDTNVGGKRTLKSFLKVYLAIYPNDVSVVAEAIEKYIGAGQVAEVLSEEQMRKVESKTIAEADAGELRKIRLQKIEELNKCRASLNALREKKENRSIWNYIFTAKWIYDPLSNEIEDMERKVKEYEDGIAELESIIKERDLDLIKNIKVEILGVTEKSSAPISAPDLTTTSVGEQGTGASETGQGKATVNSSEW